MIAFLSQISAGEKSLCQYCARKLKSDVCEGNLHYTGTIFKPVNVNYMTGKF